MSFFDSSCCSARRLATRRVHQRPAGPGRHRRTAAQAGSARSALVSTKTAVQVPGVGGDQAAVDETAARHRVRQGAHDDQLVGVGDQHPLGDVGVVRGAAQTLRRGADPDDPGQGVRARRRSPPTRSTRSPTATARRPSSRARIAVTTCARRVPSSTRQRRHQSLVPLRHHLSRIPHADESDWLPGRQRWWLGSLRGPGEGSADHRVHPDRECARLEPSTAQHDPDRVLVSAHQSVPLRPVRCGHTLRDNRQGAAGRQIDGRRHRAKRSDGMDAVLPHLSYRNPLDLSDDAAAAGQPVGEYVVDQLKLGELDFAGEDPDAPQNYPRILSIWRANLLAHRARATSTSSSTCLAPIRRYEPLKLQRNSALAM